MLDVGVGAGRVALELQARGREVVAIDVSPGAVEVARKRGVSDVRLLALEDVDASLGHFDTVVMYGNNFGLFASRAKARRLLRRLRPIADRIVACSNDPYATEDPAHLAYQERNRARGRMSGQLRVRIRYRTLIDPWFEYLIVSPDEMAEIVDGTGWQISRLVQDEGSLVRRSARLGSPRDGRDDVVRLVQGGARDRRRALGRRRRDARASWPS